VAWLSLWQHLKGELAASLELFDVGHGGGGDVVEGLLGEEGAVRADEHVGVGLEQLELLVPGAVPLRGAQRGPVLEEQCTCMNPGIQAPGHCNDVRIGEGLEQLEGFVSGAVALEGPSEAQILKRIASLYRHTQLAHCSITSALERGCT
jgi:hypothetical protein